MVQLDSVADHGPGAEVLALKPGDTALDLGCGAGENAAHLAGLGMRAVGIDLSPKQLAKARDRWSDVEGMELHQGDALAYPAHGYVAHPGRPRRTGVGGIGLKPKKAPDGPGHVRAVADEPPSRRLDRPM